MLLEKRIYKISIVFLIQNTLEFWLHKKRAIFGWPDQLVVVFEEKIIPVLYLIGPFRLLAQNAYAQIGEIVFAGSSTVSISQKRAGSMIYL